MIAWSGDGSELQEHHVQACGGGALALDTTADDLLASALAVAEHATVAEALPALAHLLLTRCQGELAVLGFESPLGGGRRLLAAVRADGFDATLSSTLVSIEGEEITRTLSTALPGAVLTVCELPVGARALCTLWLARRGEQGPLDASLLRMAGMALRAAISHEALEACSAMTESLQRRDRRDAIVGRLARAAAPSLAASHASLAAVQSCLLAELAELRVVAGHHGSPHAAVAMLREASGFAHKAWQVVSGIACFGDDASMSCDVSQVIQSAVALAAPYLASRATLEVLPARTPLARITPAALTEATVVLLTRMAQRFVDAPGHMTVAVSSVPGGVEVEFRAAASDLSGVREQDEAVVEAFDRTFSERFGGTVAIARDAAGALCFRMVLPCA